MIDVFLNLPDQCAMYHVTLLFLVILLIESVIRLKGLRWVISSIIYLTIGMWYFIDPPYRMEAYLLHRHNLPLVYTQVLIFLVAFRFMMGNVRGGTPTTIIRAFDPRELDRGAIIRALLCFWVALFLIGMYRADFRFLETLFPLGNRWTSAQMWARGRFGGATDFLVSVGSYCYMLCCASFGVIAVATRKPWTRVQMVFLIAATWPMFALGGARSTFLTVAMPSILAVLTIKKWNRSQQIAFVSLCFVGINFLMLIVIAFRNDGMAGMFSKNSANVIADTKHLGLNMPEELVYINYYLNTGDLKVEWGGEYFAQAVNFVPRGLWPGKPFPAEDFAALRVGYLNGHVAATISHGVIGQGVHNFGRWIGPLAPAAFMAILVHLMCELTKTGLPFLRSFLVLFLMALIPNLGRDLTLFTLWPAIFAYVGVRIYESVSEEFPESSAGRTANRNSQLQLPRRKAA